jgi:hypothetical protein
MRTPTLLSRDLLTVYVNDHLAGGAFGRDLAARTLAANRGTEFEAPLAALATAIEEDLRSADEIRARLGIPRDRVKAAGGWAAEKVGRLKPNGQLTGYSPLSRLLELEGLAGGVQAKRSLWQALRVLAPREPRLDTEELDRLIARADEQLDELESLRPRAAALALGGG